MPARVDTDTGDGSDESETDTDASRVLIRVDVEVAVWQLLAVDGEGYSTFLGKNLSADRSHVEHLVDPGEWFVVA